MAFIVRIDLAADLLPDFDQLLCGLEEELNTEVLPDEETTRLRQAGQRSSSWCCWPCTTFAVYAPADTTRGVEVAAESSGATASIHVTIPGLASWTDWHLGIVLACQLTRNLDSGIRVDGEGAFLAEGLLHHFLEDDRRFYTELQEASQALANEVNLGRIVRIGGPGGTAAIGPRTWGDLGEADEEELGCLLIERIQASIDRKGCEDWHVANPIALEGREGQDVVAAVLAPDIDTVFRNPEFLLLSRDLESVDQPGLVLLPFESLDALLPGVPRWLDDETCAVPAIPQAQWHLLLNRAAPLALDLGNFLDRTAEETLSTAPAPGLSGGAQGLAAVSVGEGRLEPPRRPWWKFW